MQNVVPENLREASLEQLLYLALAGDGGGDLLTSALDAALTDLEVVYQALATDGDGWAADALHQVQTRLRVVRELARRHASASRAKP
jgi:DNA repair ATPase RecN